MEKTLKTTPLSTTSFYNQYHPYYFIKNNINSHSLDKSAFSIPDCLTSVSFKKNSPYTNYIKKSNDIFIGRLNLIRSLSKMHTETLTNNMQKIREASFIIGQCCINDINSSEQFLCSSLFEWVYYYEDITDSLSKWTYDDKQLASENITQNKIQYIKSIIEYILECLWNGISNNTCTSSKHLYNELQKYNDFKLELTLLILLGESAFIIGENLHQLNPRENPSILSYFMTEFKNYCMSVVASNAYNIAPTTIHEYNEQYRYNGGANKVLYLTMIMGIWKKSENIITSDINKKIEILNSYFNTTGSVIYFQNALAYYKDVGQLENSVKAICIANILHENTEIKTPKQHGQLLKKHLFTRVGYKADQLLLQQAVDVFEAYINADKLLLESIEQSDDFFIDIVQCARSAAQQGIIANLSVLFITDRYATGILAPFLSHSTNYKTWHSYLKKCHNDIGEFFYILQNNSFYFK